MAQVLNGARAVLEDVGETDVARLPHVVLQVLPAAGRWQAAHYHAVLGPENDSKQGCYPVRTDLRAGGPLPPLPGTPLAPLKLPPPPFGNSTRSL